MVRVIAQFHTPIVCPRDGHPSVAVGDFQMRKIFALPGTVPRSSTHSKLGDYAD